MIFTKGSRLEKSNVSLNLLVLKVFGTGYLFCIFYGIFYGFVSEDLVYRSSLTKNWYIILRVLAERRLTKRFIFVTFFR